MIVIEGKRESEYLEIQAQAQECHSVAGSAHMGRAGERWGCV